MVDLVLRPYQIRVLDQVWAALQVKLNVLITAPCAAGKAILFAKIIQRLLRENPEFRALILVDREILVTQSRDKLYLVAPELGGDIGIVCASVTTAKDLHQRVTVASRQTIINQLNRFPPVQLTIIDECHLMAIPRDDDPEPDQFAQIIKKLWEYNPKMRLVGCTASPYRLGTGYIHGGRNKGGSRPYFDVVDAEVTTRELLDGGFIAPMVGRVRTGKALAEDLQTVSITAGEYNLGQLSEVMCKETHVQSCVDAWREYASDRRKTIIFCATIEHAEAVAAAFKDAGVSATAIHSKLPPIEEASRMRALRQGSLLVFTSVAKLTTGMDVVDIDCIIMARPTKSTALYQQCVGRGQRIADGKIDCLVIDLVGATQEFGTDMDNLKVTIPRDSSGDAPFKICPGEKQDGTVCGQSVHASLKFCPYCSFEFPIDPAVEAKLGKLEKVKFNEAPEPDEYHVEHVRYQVHMSQSSGKALIRVEYDCGFYARKIYEYLCLPDYYDGYAVAKARAWWAERSQDEFPDTVQDFMTVAEYLPMPTEILVTKDGKYYRVVGYKFPEYGEYEAKELIEEEIPF